MAALAGLSVLRIVSSRRKAKYSMLRAQKVNRQREKGYQLQRAREQGDGAVADQPLKRKLQKLVSAVASLNRS